jgi:hypothetical protein
MNKAESDVFLKTIYRKRFSKILNCFVNYFKDKQNFYLLNTDTIGLNITNENILSSFNLGQILVESFYSDYVNSLGDDEMLNKLYQIVPKEIIASELFKLKSFFTYEYVLYSHIHSYLLISPLYERIFNEFNKAIKDQNYTRKYLYYTGSDHVISSIFKLLYYKHPDYVRTSEDDKLSEEEMLKKRMLYLDCPFIDFGYSLNFELWESQERSQKLYYIGFRQNNNPNLTFFMAAENFLEAMKLFYLDPTMTTDERKDWCG